MPQQSKMRRIAKLPRARDVEEFAFDDTSIGETLARDLAGGEFLAHQRNVVLISGARTGKTHLAIAIARACIRDGARGGFFSTWSTSSTSSRRKAAQADSRMADYLGRLDFVVPDGLGYLAFAQSGGQFLFHVISRPYEQTSIIVTTNLAFGDWPSCSATPR